MSLTYPPQLIVAAPHLVSGEDPLAFLERERIRIARAAGAVATGGHICWMIACRPGQEPLDLLLGPVFRQYGLVMRNRILWYWGEDPAMPGLGLQVLEPGFHAVLWFTRPEPYTFQLDPVRIPQRYRNKTAYRGPRKGQLSCDPLGKNPGDVWFVDPSEREQCGIIPPSIARRLTLALTAPGDTVCLLDSPSRVFKNVAGELGRWETDSLPVLPPADPLSEDPVLRQPTGVKVIRGNAAGGQAAAILRLSRSGLIKPRFGDGGAPVTLYHGDCRELLSQLPDRSVPLIITSPPYNLGQKKWGERRIPLTEYVAQQAEVIAQAAAKLTPDGTFCWQVGNYAFEQAITPLDELFHAVFTRLGFRAHRRYTWYFRHGEHAKVRFSGRYEAVICYSRVPDPYYDPSLIPEGDTSIWDIPPVKHNHVEKTIHPCQFPIELVERLVVSRSRPGDLVLDMYMGVGGTPVGATLHERHAAGSDLMAAYVDIAAERVRQAALGKLPHRPMGRRIGLPA